MDKYIKMMIIGFLIILAGGLLYLGLRPILESNLFGGKKFVVSNARYYMDFDETSIELTYNGYSPVNVSVTFSTYWEGTVMNWTSVWQVMEKNETYDFSCPGYSTSCFIVYDGYKIKINFVPEYTTISESLTE